MGRLFLRTCGLLGSLSSMSGGRAETGPPERKQGDCDFESVFSGTGYVTEKNSSNWAGVRIDPKNVLLDK